MKKTKADLTVYLAEATINCTIGSFQLVITSASGKTRCNRDLEFEMLYFVCIRFSAVIANIFTLNSLGTFTVELTKS